MLATRGRSASADPKSREVDAKGLGGRNGGHSSRRSTKKEGRRERRASYVTRPAGLSAEERGAGCGRSIASWMHTAVRRTTQLAHHFNQASTRSPARAMSSAAASSAPGLNLLTTSTPNGVKVRCSPSSAPSLKLIRVYRSQSHSKSSRQSVPSQGSPAASTNAP